MRWDVASYPVQLLLVGLGGAVGSALRYAVSGWVHRGGGASTFPWGTLVVNLAGCLALGLLGGVAESRQVMTPAARLLVMIGLLGGFTTFSTFAYETVGLAAGSRWLAAAANAGGQVFLGVLCAWAGFTVGRVL